MDGSEPGDLPQRGREPAGAGLRAGRATLRENRPRGPRRPPAAPHDGVDRDQLSSMAKQAREAMGVEELS
ncbi:hypothetical protein FS722_26995, partial [Pseudomonas aeruginosa]